MSSVRKAVGACIAAALMFALPSVAHADVYPDPPAQDFAGGANGWTESSTTEGPCDISALCPTVTNAPAAGGADGNGYVSTQFAATLTTAAGTATGIWESPAFVYHGMAGKVPAKVSFDLNLLTSLGSLVGGLNNSSFRVDLVDQSNSSQISVVPPTLLTSNGAWTAIPTASVNPSLLTVGRSYKVRLSSSYNSGLAVNATGEVGYDNVRLTTFDKDGNSTTTNAGPNGGSGITSRKQLRNLTKTYILPAKAKLLGNKLKMKLRCPAIAAPLPCKIQVQGLAGSKFSKPATARKFVTIKAGKKRIVKIRVKPAYLARYKTAKKIFVKSTVRVGKIRVTVRKRVKLLH